MKYLILICLVSNLTYADVYKGKEDIKPDGKKTIVYNVVKKGKLLPFKTYNEGWDSLDRPKYWNGYGVDPNGINYWRYYNEETKCFKGYSDVWGGTDVCKEERERERDKEDKEKGSIPEPSTLSLLLVGWFIWFQLHTRHTRQDK